LPLAGDRHPCLCSPYIRIKLSLPAIGRTVFCSLISAHRPTRQKQINMSENLSLARKGKHLFRRLSQSCKRRDQGSFALVPHACSPGGGTLPLLASGEFPCRTRDETGADARRFFVPCVQRTNLTSIRKKQDDETSTTEAGVRHQFGPRPSSALAWLADPDAGQCGVIDSSMAGSRHSRV